MTIQIESKHFKAKELRCKHCGRGGVKAELLEVLEDLRAKAGPIVINSGYRCASHPIEAAKLKPGYHFHGLAADIRATQCDLKRLYEFCRQDERIKGIGVDHQGWYIHIDLREAVVPVTWKYVDGRAVVVADPFVRSGAGRG
jgi:uncharacterized protein YcbK (DUF882 family)